MAWNRDRRYVRRPVVPIARDGDAEKVFGEAAHIRVVFVARLPEGGAHLIGRIFSHVELEKHLHREFARLAPDIVTLIANAEALTRENNGINLTIALSYGGRAEIVAAVRALAAKAASGELQTDEIDEDLISRHLFTSDIPDPDLLIRTSGEQRISNFLLWQCAYSELVFTKTLWPDFGEADLMQAIADFGCRERRYGASVGSR